MRPIVTIFEEIHADGTDLLREFSEVRIRLGLERALVLEACKDSDVIILKSVVQVDEEMLDFAPRLRVVGRAGTGVDNIDLVACEKRGVKVLTVPTGNTVTAAEFTVMQILMLCRRMPEVLMAVGESDFRRSRLEGRELQQLTVGIVGLGNVGRAVAERLLPFGCDLIGYDPFVENLEWFKQKGIDIASSIEQLMKKIDLLTLHARLTSDNSHMIGEEQLSMAKQGILLVNSARAGLVDDKALLKALDDAQVGFAALDVLDPEPPFDLEPGCHDYSHPLLGHTRVLVSPHIGASTVDAQRKIAVDLVSHIREVI